MTKTIITLLLLLSINLLKAQLINGNFESIVESPDNSEVFYPTNWKTESESTQTTEDAYSGNYAVKVWTWYYYVQGKIMNGTPEFFNKKEGGTPIHYLPKTLSGNYKYIYGENIADQDTALIEVIVSKWNSEGTKRDTIGYGKALLDSTSIYQPFEIQITEEIQGSVPDTILVYIQSSVSGRCKNESDGNCLYLFVDNLELDKIVSASESTEARNHFQLYPNPSNGSITIEFNNQLDGNIEIFNISGQLILKTKINEQKMHFDKKLTKGVYFVKFRSENTSGYKKLIVQ